MPLSGEKGQAASRFVPLDFLCLQQKKVSCMSARVSSIFLHINSWPLACAYPLAFPSAHLVKKQGRRRDRDPSKCGESFFQPKENVSVVPRRKISAGPMRTEKPRTEARITQPRCRARRRVSRVFCPPQSGGLAFSWSHGLLFRNFCTF